MRGLVIGGISAAIAAAAIGGNAQASLLRFNSLPGIESLGSFSGEMNWTAPVVGSGDCGTLILTLTNTSSADNGGYITGFAFNVVDGLTLEFVPDSSTLPGWDAISDVNAPPLGHFDVGAALGGNWLGGGSPHNGIFVGTSKSFTFMVCGDEKLLTTIAIQEIFDDEAKGNIYGFAGRFRGFDDGGSDKVPANLPAPGALALVALHGFAARARRR
jgi:hypothetical protein